MMEKTKGMVKAIISAEDQIPIDMHRAAWQAILKNFRKYVECQ